MSDKKLIYMDSAATTNVAPEVLEAMTPYFKDKYGNASAIYDLAQESKTALENSRKIIADTIGANPSEIYFTSCGTESDNWALKSIAAAYKAKGNHIITSKIEHHAIHNTCKTLEKEGYEVTYLDVDEYGTVKLEELKKAIKPTTILISIMYANNEIGTIQPISEIAKIAKEKKIFFHTDAVQAYAHIPISVEKDGFDMMSVSGHKFNAPKGVGFLYCRKGINLIPLLDGGAQESNRRAGTENIPYIVGMAKAAEIAHAKMEERAKSQKQVRDHLIERIINEIPYTRLNGHRENRLPNNVNTSIRFIEGESLLLSLNDIGVCASTGSACASGSLDPSHVLLAIGLPHEIAHGSLRLSIDHKITMEDADYVVDHLKQIVENLRSMSPLYEDFKKQNP